MRKTAIWTNSTPFALLTMFTAQKTVFSFSKCFEMMVFPKKLRWNMIFFVLSGKMMFLFNKNMIFSLDRIKER